MHFSLAANYDSDFVPELAAHPVREVYGKLPADVVGGGRPSYMGSPVGWQQLRAYVAALGKHGIAFNYLLNSSCLGNREWGRGWQRRFMKLVESLGEIGVTRLTVSTPYLLEVLKARFPEFAIRVGIFAQVDTPARARFWEELGADAITLESFSINRDFERLEQIRASVSCELQLIANHVCLPNCPMQPYHQNGFAHSSDGNGGLFVDYCLLRCARRRLQDPSLFIKAGWIRPEDLRVYEKLGYDSFKLLERGIPSSELSKRVKAYGEQCFEGNLGDLILSYGFREPLARSRSWGLRHFFKPLQASPARLTPLLDLARQQGMLFATDQPSVTIDSQAIPAAFLQTIAQQDCGATGCRDCGYCDDVAAQAVHVDDTFREESLRRFADVEAHMVKGELWGV